MQAFISQGSKTLANPYSKLFNVYPLLLKKAPKHIMFWGRLKNKI